MPRNVALLIGLVIVPVVGCAARSPMRTPAVQAQVGVGPSPATSASDLAAERAETNRLLVRRAAMDVVVDDVARAAARAQSVLVQSGGYVEKGERSERSASFTLRVPEASLDAVLDSLSTLGRVASRTVSAEDVTRQAIDLDSRLQALIATRDRLRELQRKATTVADVIAVEHELARVQGDVDSLDGQLKYLRSAAALANVQLSVRQKIVLGPLGLVAQGIGSVLAKLFILR